MAFRRSILTGGSYGRAQAVVVWALDNWVDYDTWCCLKGINIFEESCYRFHSLALLMIKDGMNEKELHELELTFKSCDDIKHPLQDMIVPSMIINNSKTELQRVETRYKYVPSWWKGEDAAYRTAQAAMHGVSALPKMKQ